MKKIWDKKSMLNFSRQAYNEKVTDCHALFRILRFFELGCFLGRNACYELCMLIACTVLPALCLLSILWSRLCMQSVPDNSAYACAWILLHEEKRHDLSNLQLNSKLNRILAPWFQHFLHRCASFLEVEEEEEGGVYILCTSEVFPAN